MTHRFFIIFSILMGIAWVGISQTPDFTGIKVCIDPGHSGHEGDDRGMSNGFWESESNLTKGLWLKALLEDRGCEVFITRTTNTGDDSVDDWPLSQRAQLANDNNADLFISIHSNAGSGANYPMTIFNGKSETPAIPEAKEYAIILWNHLITNEATHWTNTSPHYIGDLTLNPDFTYGYGVLYPLEVPGIISEGCMHDYGPEMYRLLNLDYRRQESWNIYYSMVEYFNLSGKEPLGQITGLVHDSLQANPLFNLQNSMDGYKIVTETEVKLLETGEVYDVGDLANAQWYFTNYPDKLCDFQAGYYYFDSLPAGTYHLVFTADKYVIDTIEVSVQEHQFTYYNHWLKFDTSAAPEIVSNYPLNKDTVACNDPISLTFNIEMDSNAVVNAFHITPETEGQFTWDEKHMVVTFQPNEPYATQVSYTVVVDTTAKHKWGVNLEEEYQLQFFTGNRNRYQVISSFPDSNQLDVNPYLQFRVMFDAPINNTTLIDAVSIISEQGDVIGTKSAIISVVDGQGYYYFKPEADLEYEKNYTLKLSGTIQDANKIPLVEDVEIPFTTQPAMETPVVLDELESTDEWYLDYNNSIALDPGSFIYRWTKDFRSGDASILTRYIFIENQGNILLKSKETLQVTSGYDNIGLWIWGDLSYNSINLVFDNQQKLPLGAIDFAGWNYWFAAIPEGVHAIEAIEIEHTSTGSTTGDIYFDALGVLGYNDINEQGFAQIEVYPNPRLDETINVSGLPDNELVSYRISNILGQVLQEGQSISSNNGNIQIKMNTKDDKSMLILIISHGTYRYTKLIK